MASAGLFSLQVTWSLLLHTGNGGSLIDPLAVQWLCGLALELSGGYWLVGARAQRQVRARRYWPRVTWRGAKTIEILADSPKLVTPGRVDVLRVPA